MSNFLYLDIETLPTADPFHVAAIAESITPPGNYKNPETIAKWAENEKPALIKEAIAKTSFDGAYGRVACIGWAIDDAPPQTVSGMALSELDVIKTAFDLIGRAMPQWATPTIVGHFVAGFDIRFIWQRAFVHGVKLPAWFPRDPKPWSNEVNDTQIMWCGSKGNISLDNLCKALGVPGKNGVTGADVATLWAAGEYEKVCEYCRSDVERVRNVHRKMRLAFGEAA